MVVGFLEHFFFFISQLRKWVMIHPEQSDSKFTFASFQLFLLHSTLKNQESFTQQMRTLWYIFVYCFLTHSDRKKYF